MGSMKPIENVVFMANRNVAFWANGKEGLWGPVNNVVCRAGAVQPWR